MPFLFLMFLIVPIAEMWLLIRVGSIIGTWQTIALVTLTAVLGINLLRQQGLSTLMKANQRLQAGEMPAQELIAGLILAIGGALLLTPGFMTDAVGFACLLPFSRNYLIKHALTRFKSMGMASVMSASMTSEDSSVQFTKNPNNRAHGDIIEGEFRRKE